MREGLDEPVSVIWYYNATKRHVQPFSLSWNNLDYRLGKVDFHHQTRRGTTLLHHFSLADAKGQVYFKLQLDTDTLFWTIEEFMYAGDVTVTYGK